VRIATSNKSNKNHTQKRFIAIAILLCFFIVFFISEAYILTHAEHEHDHDGIDGNCAVCAYIQNAENFLRLIKSAVKNISLIVVGLFLSASSLYSVFRFAKFLTPIKLKVRMND